MTADQINKRLTQLETTVKERWVSHDKRSEDVWREIQQLIGEIKESHIDTSNQMNMFMIEYAKNMGELDCKVNRERINNLKIHIKWLWGCLAAIYTATITWFFNHGVK